MEKLFIIINEQHEILPDQERLLEKEFPGRKVEKILVPAKGWNLQEVNKKSKELFNRALEEKGDIVILSPIPVLIKILSERSVIQSIKNEKNGYQGNVEIYIFHNDKREKKELPNGKIITIVAKEGWQLV